METNKINKRKILFYTDCFIFGGCELVLANLINYEKLYNEYDIFFSYRISKEYEKMIDFYIKNKNYKRIPLNILSNDSFFYQLSLKKSLNLFDKMLKLLLITLAKFQIYRIINFLILLNLFKKIKPDILHINNGGYPGADSCRIAVLSAKFAKIKKIIFTVNNMAYPAKNYIDKLLDKYINKFVDIFTTASNSAALRLKEVRNFNKVINIPNTLSPFRTIKEEDDILFKEYNINKDKNKIIFGTAGLLTYRKGFNILIEAAYHLINENINNFIIFIFGEGEERKNLENLIIKYNLKEYVYLPGHKHNIIDYIKCFDVFILPSVSNEDFPYVILEAMSLKKPIIGTNIAGIPEEVIDNENGFIVKPSDVLDLKEKLKIFINDSSLINKMGEKSYNFYQNKFSYNYIMDKYINLYNDLLRG